MKEMLGMQIGRVFIGDRYTGALYRMGGAIIVLNAFLNLSYLLLVFAIFPLWILVIWLLGSYADKSNLNKKQLKKTIMQNEEGVRELVRVIMKEEIIPVIIEVMNKKKLEI